MPITAANIRFHDLQFSLQVGTGLWRWTTRMDLSASVPVFQVKDILTPFGMLRDSVAIPGDVILAMRDSIEQFKANFPPSILIGPPTSLSFTVNEGQGFSDPETVVLTNDGVYGSLLGATLTPSAAYVSVTPASVGNLASNETGEFDVAVDSTTLVAGTYNEQVAIADPNAADSPQNLPVTIVVRPKATINTNVAQLNFTVVRPLSGPFPAIPTQNFIVENTGPGGSLLDFQVQALTGLATAWLSNFTPVTGSLASAATQAVTVTVAPVEGLAVGTYEETLRISGYSTNSYVDVVIQLVVT